VRQKKAHTAKEEWTRLKQSIDTLLVEDNDEGEDSEEVEDYGNGQYQADARDRSPFMYYQNADNSPDEDYRNSNSLEHIQRSRRLKGRSIPLAPNEYFRTLHRNRDRL
jgi:hypothetical protein